MVRIRNIEDRELIATAPELGRSYMEVRGLGIINVAALFGVGTVRTEKRLDLIVNLKREDDMNDLDRVGLDRASLDVLGMEVPHIELQGAERIGALNGIQFRIVDGVALDFGYRDVVEEEVDD